MLLFRSIESLRSRLGVLLACAVTACRVATLAAASPRLRGARGAASSRYPLSDLYSYDAREPMISTLGIDLAASPDQTWACHLRLRPAAAHRREHH